MTTLKGIPMLHAAPLVANTISLDEWRRTSPELRAAKLAARPEAEKNASVISKSVSKRSKPKT